MGPTDISSCAKNCSRKVAEAKQKIVIQLNKRKTYDWDVLFPLALPPDLPPVILIDFCNLVESKGTRGERSTFIDNGGC